MISKDSLKQIILEQQDELRSSEPGLKREKLSEFRRFLKLPHVIVVAGIRRVGKSTLLRQIMFNYYKENYYYFSFEDERLINFDSTDFNNLYEVFIELFDERKIFFFDEIQNIIGWEKFVRRMQDVGFKFFVSGSNATLLSKELGTRLTGRHITIFLLPFSFREFLEIKNVFVNANDLKKTKVKAKISRLFSNYLKSGGMPEYLKYGQKEILKSVYEDILYRDIAARFDIKEITALRELALFYITNIGSFISFNKLKHLLKLGSVNTIKAYTEYLENSFLFFTVNHYAYSLKKQYIAPKKVYCIDNGIASAIAFSFSENQGRFLENLVFIELKRRGHEIFYYKTKSKKEVDFVILKDKKPDTLIQVCWDLLDEKTRLREVAALEETIIELKVKNALILTNDDIETPLESKKIQALSVWKWLLQTP